MPISSRFVSMNCGGPESNFISFLYSAMFFALSSASISIIVLPTGDKPGARFGASSAWYLLSCARCDGAQAYTRASDQATGRLVTCSPIWLQHALTSSQASFQQVENVVPTQFFLYLRYPCVLIDQHKFYPSHLREVFHMFGC